MARVVVTTWGSSGDVNPFLILAHHLHDRGHDLIFAVEDHLAPRVRAAGFVVHPLSGNSQAALESHAGQLFGSSPPLFSVRAVVTGYVLPTLPARIAELRAACAGADMLIASAGQIAASFVAELTGIAWVSIALTPTNIPSSQAAPIPVPDLPGPLGALLNRFVWAGGERVITGSVARPLDALRERYGLPPLRCPLPIRYLSRLLTVVPVSPAFFPRPTDWPQWAHLSGFCFWDERERWRELESLTTFLDTPAPVIAISSGSMSGDLGGRFTCFYRLCIAAVAAVGAKALVIGAPEGVLPDPLPDGVFAIPYAPFARVYPRCAAIIHHGGIGTTAQGLRAGVPALVMPWGIDQFFNGDRVARIGAGQWISRDRCPPHRIARVLRALLTEDRYWERARMVAAAIAREDGVGALCNAIEGLPALRQRTLPARIADFALPIAAGE
jgi:UDP:flavonoid glycosyltransferase YjiC (YdhE family)